MTILLAPGVHATSIDGDLVLLDAQRDEYLCIGRRAAGTLHDRLTMPEQPASELEIALEEQGLIVRAGARLASHAANPPPRIDLSDVPATSIRPTDILALLIALVLTLIWLWRLTPAGWFARVATWPHLRDAQPDADTLALARRFRRLRPWVPRSGRCLVQSLLLLHFLRLHHRPAIWVFGVRTHPFEAHCWLEHGGVVLDDTIEHVRWFTPIVRVGHGS